MRDALRCQRSTKIVSHGAETCGSPCATAARSPARSCMQLPSACECPTRSIGRRSRPWLSPQSKTPWSGVAPIHKLCCACFPAGATVGGASGHPGQSYCGLAAPIYARPAFAPQRQLLRIATRSAEFSCRGGRPQGDEKVRRKRNWMTAPELDPKQVDAPRRSQLVVTPPKKGCSVLTLLREARPRNGPVMQPDAGSTGSPHCRVGDRRLHS